ncbi:MAG: SnoaL-like domain-containing protein [Rhodospirillaceae bacterium]|nr:SnoaL-like domain-containing protein [Rhodospirillaceae bacterium]MBT3492589.1 SnoaL-like domain-containing protein [Rhodospirillaceae bacterium]MBT3782458.1 SnoaL-like domain-containing protein [Rhodospirillaceae bacterium]MBT4170941.1 SnoaL-like domain-containing protein [Rhodospirillaceae bacterium]MBT4565165.1 SnoaL-like domain-containing protein [Rhodospirillaceae bacterium]
MNVIIDDVIDAGDKVVTRATGYGTHTGEFRGMAPTGRRIEVRIISISRIAGGRIVERWENMATMTLMQQIGAIPE